jgi:multiple sugar transport system permease protein
MADDSTFRSALVFTLLFALLATAGTTVVGLALALLVRNSRRGISFFRTSYFLPVVIGFATASFLWVWLFNDQVGPLDAMLRAVGVVSGPVGFLSGPTSALFSIVGMTVWKSAGFAMLVFLVGLQAIPEELYEAARIDGAGRWSLLRYITMPLLRPALALVLVLMLTQNFLAFDQFLIMTRGGPSNSTITAVYWIYNNAFVKFDLGYAAAIAIVLLVALVAINYVQLRAVREEQTQ